MAADLLLEGFYHTRPAETSPGAAERIFVNDDGEIEGLF